MSKAKTNLEIQDRISLTGFCTVPFSVIEYLLGITHDDDDTFETAVSDMVDSTEWAHAYEIDWISNVAIFKGTRAAEII